MYWTLDKSNNTPGLFKNRELLQNAYSDKLTDSNLNYHFSRCKKMEVVISNIWIIRFKL